MTLRCLNVKSRQWILHLTILGNLFHNENLQECDKFDKALLKKRVDPSVIMQAKNCPDYVACKNQMGKSFGVIPLTTFAKV